MSDFITRLAQRQLGQIATVMPRLPEVFAPLATPVLSPSVEDISVAAAAPLQSNSQPTKATNTILEIDSVVAAASSKPASARLAVSPEIAVNQVAGRDAIDEPHATSSVKSSRTDIASVLLPSSIPTMSMERPSPRPTESARDHLMPENTVAPVFTASAVSDQPARLITVDGGPSITAPPRLESQRSNRGGIVEPERSAAAAEPPIEVTIGRIEVTAVQQSAPAKRAPAPRKPAMSLDDYLARRQRRQS